MSTHVLDYRLALLKIILGAKGILFLYAGPDAYCAAAYTGGDRCPILIRNAKEQPSSSTVLTR
jgi:hypothetical protein